MPDEEPGAAGEAAGDAYEVESLVDYQVIEGQQYFMVKWKGFEEHTWEPEQNLMDET
jgi:hypothetical protein